MDRGRELAVVQIDFSAAFDRVSHSGLLYKLWDVGVGGAVFEVIAGFLSGRVQKVVVDGIRSENVRLVSGVPLLTEVPEPGNRVQAVLFS